MINLHRVAPIAIALSLIAATASAEERVITTCPPELDYCVRVTKPVLSQTEALIREARSIAAGRQAAIDGDARRADVRRAANYRDPNAINLCPAPYRMTELDGCQPAR